MEKIHLAFLSQCCHEVQCDKQKQVWEREKIWEIELFETWQIFSNEYLKQIRKFWQFEENSSIQDVDSLRESSRRQAPQGDPKLEMPIIIISPSNNRKPLLA